MEPLSKAMSKYRVGGNFLDKMLKIQGDRSKSEDAKCLNET